MKLPLSKLNLREKTLIFSLLIVIFPFLVSNAFWYFNAEKSAYNNSENNIIVVTQEAARNVENFLNTKLLGFLSHSQNAAILSGDENLIEEDLLNFLQQDPDIETLTYADSSGNEIVKVSRNKIYPKNELKNIKENPEFKITTFRYGNEYISDVMFHKNNKPKITIAVPVVFPERSSSLLTFSSFQITQRSPGEIYGVVVGEIDLSRFGNDATSLSIGQNGYVYMIDRDRKIIAHPDGSKIGKNNNNQSDKKIKDILSKELLKDAVIDPYASTNTDGTDVLTTLSQINKTDWSIVAEQPISDISSDISRIQRQAIILFSLPLSFAFLLSFLFSQRLVSPIKELVKGTVQIGKGDFDYDFSINTGDELERLASYYHEMAQKLKQDRNSLIAEKDTLSTILGNIADGVIALDKNLKILLQNNASSEILEIKTSSIINHNIEDTLRFQEKDLDVNIRELCSNAKSGLISKTLSFNTASKKNKTIQAIFIAIKPEIISDIRYIITFFDISKEQELENMKIDFVSMAAHELRTPITAMRGYSKMLKDEIWENATEEQKEFMLRIINSSSNLSNLVDNLLNASRIEKGTLQLDKRPYNLLELAEIAIKDLEQVAKTKKQIITLVKPKEDLPLVLLDKFRIIEVFTNLVANAINYSPPEGKISISVEKQDNFILTKISDNGEGIPEAAISRLFSKFFRVGGKLEQGSKGTGLGLFITKSILDLHDGKIWVESTVGKGSTFFFKLPIASQKDIDNFKTSSKTTVSSKGFFVNPDRNKKNTS